MMTTKNKYSPTTNMFYPAAWISRYVEAGTLPDDAYDVEEDIYQTYCWGAPPEGKLRGCIDGVNPEWIDIPPKTAEQILAINTAEYTRRMRQCTDAAFPLQSAVNLGAATEEQKTMLADLQSYAVQLLDTKSALAQLNLSWPPIPDFIS